jgi:lipopolysaccharide export system permease protein
MILHRYFARKYFSYYASVLAIFTIFIALIDLVEQIRRFGNNASFAKLMELTASNIPATIYKTMPLIMILSSVWMFLSLARSSELVVTRSVGRSPLQFLMAPVVVAGVIGIFIVTIFNPIVAASAKHFAQTRETVVSGKTPTFSVGSEGLWLRQGEDTGQTVIRAERSNHDGTVLYDVTLVTLSEIGRPIRRIEATSAALSAGEWTLGNAKIWPIDPAKNPEIDAFYQTSYSVPSSLTVEQIKDSFGSPITISIWNLTQYIRDLQSSGFSARRHAVWQQMEFARPIFLIAMMLIGAAFSMRHSRFGGTGMSVLIAVLLGFGLFYLRNFAQILGDNGQLPLLFAAWTPPIATLLIAMGVILHKEDG